MTPTRKEEVKGFFTKDVEFALLLLVIWRRSRLELMLNYTRAGDHVDGKA